MTTPHLQDRRVGTLPAPPAGTYTFDPAHTHVGFEARHLVVTKVRGAFHEAAGTITVGDDISSSAVEVTIEAASIDTRNAQRDEHLRSPDFLDVTQHPTLRFRSTGARDLDGARFVLDGELTVRDVTRPVALEVEYLGAQTTPWGASAYAFTARTQIDREDWGITWNQALESGGVLVSKTVTIEIDLEAVPA